MSTCDLITGNDLTVDWWRLVHRGRGGCSSFTFCEARGRSKYKKRISGWNKPLPNVSIIYKIFFLSSLEKNPSLKVWLKCFNSDTCRAGGERAVCVKWRWGGECGRVRGSGGQRRTGTCCPPQGGISYINLMYFIFFHANLWLAKTLSKTLQGRMSSLTNEQPECNIDIVLVQW